MGGMQDAASVFGELRYGLAQMESHLISAGKGAEVGRVLNDAAQPILRQMQAQTKSDPKMISGDLHDALKAYKGVSRNRYQSRITIGVHRRDWHKDDYYPAYVEFGHGGPRPAPPHPYIRPAYDAKADEAYDKIKDGLFDLTGRLKQDINRR